MKLIRYQYPQTPAAAAFNQFFDLAGPSFGRVGSLFEDFFNTSSEFSQPAADLYEDDNSYVARLELPGIARDELDLELENGVLTIASANPESVEGAESKWSFQRSISVPDSVDSGAVSASLIDGVLTVTMPKAAASKPRQITVE